MLLGCAHTSRYWGTGQCPPQQRGAPGPQRGVTNCPTAVCPPVEDEDPQGAGLGRGKRNPRGVVRICAPLILFSGEKGDEFMGCGAQSGLPRPRSCSSPPVRVGPKPRTGKASRTASRSRYRHFSAHQACIIIIILTNLSSFHFLFHFVFIFYLFIYIYFFKREKCLKRIWAKKQVKLTRAPNSLWCVREARSPQGRICPCSPRSWRVARGWGVSRCYGATPKPLLKPPPPCQSPPCLADASPCAALQCKTETVWGSTNFPAFCSGAPEELRTRRVPGGPRGPVPIPGRGVAVPGFRFSVDV